MLEQLVEANSDALYEIEDIMRGVSVRTIQNDIQVIRSDRLDNNAPIEMYDNKYYRYAEPHFSVTSLPLIEDDGTLLRQADNGTDRTGFSCRRGRLGWAVRGEVRQEGCSEGGVGDADCVLVVVTMGVGQEIDISGPLSCRFGGASGMPSSFFSSAFSACSLLTSARRASYVGWSVIISDKIT